MLESPKTNHYLLGENVMDETMGNQQERSVADVARLAMFYDTDGSISMRIIQRANNRVGGLTPTLSLVNTNKPLMDWVESVLLGWGIPYYITIAKVRGISRLPQTRIWVHGMKRVSKLLPIITPYLIAKKEQAELIAQFMASRLANKNPKAPYTSNELIVANKIRALNSGKGKGNKFRPISSETVRAAQELQDRLGMRQSVLRRELQSAAETTAPTT
jgi:hypothetical protein